VMASRLGYVWHLRLRMAERGMFNSPELAAALRERGVALSDSQVWRLVTGTPERLNLRALVALCDILGCTPNELIEPVKQSAERPRRQGRAVDADVIPKPARVRSRGRSR
jgi:DNA-binding Xre family transcriptional regulator